MPPADKIEWLERKIMHRQMFAKAPIGPGKDLWKKIAQGSDSSSATAVAHVVECIKYTKDLVASVKQLLRVMCATAEKESPGDPSQYADIIPYPSADKSYNPLTNEHEVDEALTACVVETSMTKSGHTWSRHGEATLMLNSFKCTLRGALLGLL
jgi:hypothetical protein